ncbi:MAG TPA: hypothetical protein VK589_04975 [Chryseolinea sp.]|nr:hypothetical protein [Chryseolinea sp.]
MKAVSISEIKKELTNLDGKTLQEICLRLAKYKLENKELLTYLLFEAHDESSYISLVKEEIDQLFAALPQGNVYYIKKSLRKILRLTNRQVKYSGQAATEVEIRIYFCSRIISAGIPLQKSQVLTNLFEQQLKKIETVIAKLPEDLQYDYHRDFESLKTK